MLGAALAVAVLSACGEADERLAPEIGPAEDRLNIIAPKGFVMDGSKNPAVDWVSGFERESGCTVSVETAADPGELSRLLATGRFDGAAVGGDAALGVLEAGGVDPINTELLENYGDVYGALKDQPFNTTDDATFGVPQGRGAQLLVYNADIRPEPESWSAVFDDARAHSGRLLVPDDPMYIADAAVYLREAEPGLGIEDPYALDREQFRAAVDLLERQRPHVGTLWRTTGDQVRAFETGSASLGAAGELVEYLLNAEGATVGAVLPQEGATGWVDSWMLAANADHPNCMYLWMDHVLSPEANAAAAEWLGQAPANPKACELTSDLNHCDIYRANDEGFFDEVEYWRTPTVACGDDRGQACVAYPDWRRAWERLRDASMVSQPASG